jgi:hypothetical protein
MDSGTGTVARSIEVGGEGSRFANQSNPPAAQANSAAARSTRSLALPRVIRVAESGEFAR